MENLPRGLPRVVDGPPKWGKRFGGRRVLVCRPLVIDRLVGKVPKREFVTARQIRERLVKDF